MNLNNLDIFFKYFSFVYCFYLVLKSVNLDHLLRNLELDIMGKTLCDGKAMGPLSETPRQLEVTKRRRLSRPRPFAFGWLVVWGLTAL